RDDELLELLDVAAADLDGAKALHLALEHVGDVGDGDDLFLGDADDVAVETGTAYDALGCAGDVGGLVDDHGWVAGACGDGTLATRHGGFDHTATAGHHHEPGVGVGHDRARRVDGGFGDSGDAVLRATRRDDRLVEESDVVGAGELGVGVDVEDHRVAA